MKSERNHPDVSLYLDYLNEKGKKQFLSEKTATDLNFEDVFDYLDHTTSKVGQQYFYARLRTVNTSSYPAEQEAITCKFLDDPDLVSETEKQLKRLKKQEASRIIALFTKELPSASKLYTFLIHFLRFLPFTFAVFLFVFHVNFCIYLLILSLVVNTIIHYLNKFVQLPFEFSIPQLLVLVKCSKILQANSTFNALSSDISTSVETLEPLSKASALFKVERYLVSDLAQLGWLVMELLKIMTLTEPYLFHKAIKLLKGRQQEIENLFRFVGEIDSLLAISKIRNSEAYYCIPSVQPTNERLSFDGMYHPLIESCVSNSLTLKTKSILLTGSNMSGKSTFIRIVGVNILTAQTINTCFARQFDLRRPLILQSMITVGDDLMNSKSLFFEEVLTVRDMLINSDQGQNIFLLDEIFKGTNTLERIAAAKAVLSYLVKHDNIVFVSTHDVELAELLGQDYELYHFCEHFDNTEIEFDYLLKPGRLTAFNALKILKMSGYSDSVIQEAYRTIEFLQESKNN